MIKVPIKFAASFFGVSILLLIAAYILFPDLYPGETFLVVWFYVANLLIGSLLFSFIWRWIGPHKLRSRAIRILAAFLLILVVINILSLLIFQRSYTISLVMMMIDKPEKTATAMVELINPVVSFAIACLLFRNSGLWVGDRPCV